MPMKKTRSARPVNVSTVYKKETKPIGLSERLRRAEIGKPFVILADDRAQQFEIMRTAKSHQGRLGIKLDTKAAKVWFTDGPDNEEDYLHRAVMITVRSR